MDAADKLWKFHGHISDTPHNVALVFLLALRPCDCRSDPFLAKKNLKFWVQMRGRGRGHVFEPLTCMSAKHVKHTNTITGPLGRWTNYLPQTSHFNVNVVFMRLARVEANQTPEAKIKAYPLTFELWGGRWSYMTRSQGFDKSDHLV